MNRFEGRTVLVTGAASGIGRATTERLAREGARVLACDIDASRLRAEVQALTADGLKVSTSILDITDPTACEKAVAVAIEDFGRLDVLCNIAGTLLLKHFAEISPAEWRRVMSINIDGIFNMCQSALPHLLESKGNIVNVASAAGVVGIPYGVAYSTSKGAVVMMSKSLATEYAQRGVRVNAICPGYVVTPMTRDHPLPVDGDAALTARLSPLLTYPGQPEDIAACIAHIASDEARYTTGAAILIDGGQTAI